MPPPRYQILIPTIPHRHAKLCSLLETLDSQMVPEVRALLWRDNLEASYPQKLQGLMDAATGDYVSVLQDDDSVAPDYIPKILNALATSPDQVGFLVRHTETGAVRLQTVHSRACGGWYFDGTRYYRDYMYFNPMRRALAQQVPFRGAYCDEEWAADHRALGAVNTEVFIDDEIFYYQRDNSDNFHTSRQPFALEDIPSLPQYPWLDVLEQ